MVKPRVVIFAAVLTIAFVWLGAQQAQAHHSFAMFDEDNPIKITGTVAKYSWSNPHMLIWVAVIDAQNKATVWTIESPFGPSNLGRYGWDKNTLKAGDKVEMWISPLRDGDNGGSLQSLTFLSDGRTLYNGSRGSRGGGGPNAAPRGGPVGAAGAGRGGAGQ